MDVKLFNTLTGYIQTVVPIKRRDISMYHCGPTAYDDAHIGNLRAATTNDILCRTFEFNEFRVKQVMNITDIDDNTIERSQRDGVVLSELTRKYTDIYLSDLRLLNIKVPKYITLATEHINGMIELVRKLMTNGYAYATTDGIYFDISKSKNYGALARLDLNAETQSRIEIGDKRNERDFVLWKFWTESDGVNVYDAFFGRGRPGWHIECSVMAMDTLGETIDIHTGGVDLIFPHHTNEIAQSEASTGKRFVNYWVHNEFIMIDGKKMSKSLGNHTTLRTVIKHGVSPLAFRYWVLGTHYRAKANFVWEALDGAEVALRRLGEHMNNVGGQASFEYHKQFAEIISNDLDTPRALALAWEVAKSTTLSPADITATLLDFDRVLGLELAPQHAEAIPDEITVLAHTREEARLAKEWLKSDEIREQVKSLGWDISDTSEGQKITKI